MSYLDIEPSHFFSDFDSGSLIGLVRAAPGEFGFELQSKEIYGPQGSLTVWFYGACRLEGIDIHRGDVLRFVVRHPHRLDRMRPVYCLDGGPWRYVPEPYGPKDDGFHFRVPLEPGAARVFFAAHFPYPSSRYYELCRTADESPIASLSNIGSTECGRDILCITVDDSSVSDTRKHRVILSAGSHAGETASLWGIEGVVGFLLSGDSTASQMLRQSTFYIVPMLNVDGAALGLDRRNAGGVNLYFDYREFRAAESRAMWRFVEETRPDVWLDFHSWHLGIAEGAYAPDPDVIGAQSHDACIRPLMECVGRHFPIKNCGRDTADCPNTQAVLRYGIPGFCPEFNMGVGSDGVWKFPEHNKALGVGILRGLHDYLRR